MPATAVISPLMQWSFVGVSVLLFAIAAYFTKADLRRVGAALLGAAAAALVNMEWDLLAARFGWWRYAFSTDALPPILLYVVAGLVFGGALGLVGWRVIRRFGLSGAFGFFATFVALGVLRDASYAARGDLLVFEPGWAPYVADALGWFSLAAIAQAAIWFAGNAPSSRP